MSDPRELLDTYAQKEEILLAVGDPTCEGRWTPISKISPKAFAALCAVLDLHKSVDIEDGWDETIRTVCNDCCEPYPCPTVQAVTTALEAA